MKNILVLYPKDFNCSSKFKRKLDNILSSIESCKFYTLHDSKDLISEYIKSNAAVKSFECIENINDHELHNAVIFDDRSSFTNEKEMLQKLNIPLRMISTPITKVINIKIETDYENQRDSQYYQYIGRGSYWGNPYSMYENGDSREDVIRKYKYDFDFNKFINKDKSQVYKLHGKILGCFCKPDACHGDILADFLNSWDDGK